MEMLEKVVDGAGEDEDEGDVEKEEREGVM